MWFWLSFCLMGAFIYLPVGLFLWRVLVEPLSNYLEKREHAETAGVFYLLGLMTLPLGAVLVHGGLFGWYDHLEPPQGIVVTVDSEVQNDFYQYEERNDAIYLTVSDKNYSETRESHLVDNGYIHFEVANQDAKKERANLKWAVVIDDKTHERDNLPTATELHLFSDNFALKAGENRVTVTAKNDLGEFSKTVVIQKLTTEQECQKSERQSSSTCQRLAAANRADSEKRAAEEAERQKAAEEAERRKAALQEQKAAGASGSGGGASSGTAGNGATSGCGYYKYGQCWDEVIERAYDDGSEGAYCDSHAFYQGCEGVCQEIYDDAYDEGYYDGKFWYGR